MERKYFYLRSSGRTYMVPVTRRRLLAATGITALAGCLSEDGDGPSDESDDGTTLDPEPLPEALASVLEAVPDQVGEDAFDTIQLGRPEPTDDDGPAATIGLAAQAEAFGLGPETVDRTAMATYGQYTNQLLVASGSFDADDVDPDSAEQSALLATQETTEHVEDGLAVLAAGNDGGWAGGLEAATIARDDSDLGVLAQLPMAAALEPVVDVGTASVVRLTDEQVQQDLDVDLEAVELAVVAQEIVDETTQAMTFVFLFESASATDRSVAEALVGDAAMGVEDPEPEYETTGRRLVASFEGPLPEHQLPDDSPDLHFQPSYAGDGSVEVTVTGEGSADPENLELLVDGESVADPPWADRTEPIGPETAFEVAADLFSFVAVRWNDPEREGVSHTLGEARVGGHAQLFDHEYEPDAERLTFTYEFEEAADPERLELLHRGPQQGHQEGDAEPLSEYVDALESGTEVVVEDVAYGDTVVIRVADEEQTSRRSLTHFTAHPPGGFTVEREDGRSFLVYRGGSPQSADSYRVTVPEDSEERLDSEYVPTDSQWSDEYDSIEPGDRLELDLEIGAHGRVEWAETDEPVRVSDFQVAPDAEFAVDYDEDADEVEITHEGGEALAADELSVTAYRGQHVEEDDAFSEYDEVTKGDAIVVELPGDPPADDENGRQPGFVSVEYRDVTVTNAPLGEHSTRAAAAAGGEGAAREDAAGEATSEEAGET